MDHIKQKLESAFADFGHFSFRYPWLMVVIASVLLVFLSWHTLQMRSDTSTEGFMKPDDPALAYYNAFRDEFGRDEIIVVALEVENFYNTTTLSQFKQLHQRLETQVPYIVDVKSLVNARHIYGLDDELFIDDLLENLPQGKQALEQLKITIAQQSLYKNFYISADQKIITLMLTPAYKYDELDPKTGEKISRYLGDEQLNQIVTAIRPIVKEYDVINGRISPFISR